MKKLFLFLAFVFLTASIYSQTTPSERQVLSAGTALTRLPAAKSLTVAPTDTVIVFVGGSWIKTTVSALGGGGGGGGGTFTKDSVYKYAWSKLGNSGTTAGTNFIGTTDNVSFKIKTNNTKRVVIDSLGSFNYFLPDNIGAALNISEGGNVYQLINTQNGMENMSWGNGNNPTMFWGGTGLKSFSGNVTLTSGKLLVNENVATGFFSVAGTTSVVALYTENSSGTAIQVVDGTQGAGKVLTSDANGKGSWQAAGGSGWALTGNAGTNSGTNFIGTSDSVAFEIKSHNLLNIYISPKRFIGFGGIFSPRFYDYGEGGEFTFDSQMGRLHAEFVDNVSGAGINIRAYNEPYENTSWTGIDAGQIGYATKDKGVLFSKDDNGHVGLGGNWSESMPANVRLGFETNWNDFAGTAFHNEEIGYFQLDTLINTGIVNGYYFANNARRASPRKVAEFDILKADSCNSCFSMNRNQRTYFSWKNIDGVSTVVERMLLDSAGRLGIGIHVPTEKLHVVGNIRMVDGNQGVGKVLISDANGVGSWSYNVPSSARAYLVAQTFTTGVTAPITILTYTTVAHDTMYRVSANITITARELDFLNTEVLWTDEAGNSNTANIGMATVGGVSTSISTPGGYAGVGLDIHAKASTVITVRVNPSVGTGSATFNAGAIIQQE